MVPQVITFTKFTACNTFVRAAGGSNKDIQEIVSRPTQNSLATYRLRNIGLREDDDWRIGKVKLSVLAMTASEEVKGEIELFLT